MKKLNRKGFTLIELLAVIVILAIVVVVTIPSVISSINKAKSDELVNATATVTKWFTDQYALETLSGISGGPEKPYTDFFGDSGMPATAKNLDTTILKAAGITNTKGLYGTVNKNDTKVCVKLIASPDSTFYVTNDNNKNGDINYAKASVQVGDKTVEIENAMLTTGSGC